MFHTCPHFKGQRNHSGPRKVSCAYAHKLLTCSHSTPSCCPGLYHALKSTLEPGRETTMLCKQACYCGPAAIHSRQTANTHTPLWTVWLKLRGIWFHKLSRTCKSARINNVGGMQSSQVWSLSLQNAQKITFFQERLGTDYCKCRTHKIKCLASELWLHPSTNSFQDVQWGRGFKIADRRAASSSRALRWDVWLWPFVIQWKLIYITGLTVPKQDYPEFTRSNQPPETKHLCFASERSFFKLIYL